MKQIVSAMDVLIKVGGKEISLKMTPSGHYTPTSEKKIEGKTINLEDEKIGSISITYLKPTAGLGKVINLATALALVDKGAYLLAYVKHKDLVDEDFLHLLKETWGENTYKNFVVEVLLGSFSEETLPVSEDPKNMLKDLIENGGALYTRIVGVSYRINDLKDKNGDLKVKEGDTLYVVWEQDNPHDENALAVYHQSAVKVGYIRRTISEVLVSKVKEEGHLEGCVVFLYEENGCVPWIVVRLEIPQE